MRGQVWQGQKITLTNGVCLQAVGSGQSLRGIKHYDHRPDCLLLDDIEGDIGASTPLERETTKKWFFGTVLPALASRSIIRMAATPLDQECLPVTLGKMVTWKTMVVPVKSFRSDPNDFFNTWCTEQGIELGSDGATSLSREPEDAVELRDTLSQLVAEQRSASSTASIDELPHVAEEQRPAKSFDLVHEHVHVPVEPNRDNSDPSEVEAATPAEAARLANAERQRRFQARQRASRQGIPDSKGPEPAPSPPVAPEAQKGLSEVERAFGFKFVR